MNELQIQPAQIAITPDQMLMKGIEKGLDLAQLEKLMDLQERWQAKNARAEFFDAMANFQANKPRIVKTKKGHNSSYAPLAKIQEAIDPVATKFGLSYRFEQRMSDGKMVVTCIVTHKAGHSEKSEMEAPAETSGSKNALQSWGSTRSYLYRYTLEGSFGLSSDDDNDGNTPPKGEVKLPNPTAQQWTKIIEKFKTGSADLDTIKKSFSLTEEQNAEIKKLIG